MLTYHFLMAHLQLPNVADFIIDLLQFLLQFLETFIILTVILLLSGRVTGRLVDRFGVFCRGTAAIRLLNLKFNDHHLDADLFFAVVQPIDDVIFAFWVLFDESIINLNLFWATLPIDLILFPITVIDHVNIYIEITYVFFLLLQSY